jgi:DNA-binding GntR family transcriptional regulator
LGCKEKGGKGEEGLFVKYTKGVTKADNSSDLNSMKDIAKKSLNDIIYEHLKERILKGEILPGERLQEDNLAKDSGSSRTPFRDALRRLEQENIIEKLHYGGYQVKELTLKDIEELFGIRSVLEGYAASLATRRIKKSDIKKMEAILKKSRSASEKEDYESFVKLNTEFHEFLYAASKSEHLLGILRNLREYFFRYRRVILRTRNNLEDSIRDHEMMIQKMNEGDYQTVERLVKEHIMRALEALKKESRKMESAGQRILRKAAGPSPFSRKEVQKGAVFPRKNR